MVPHRIRRRLRLPAAAALLASAVVARGATIVVNTTDDEVETNAFTSLREAVLQANAQPLVPTTILLSNDV